MARDCFGFSKLLFCRIGNINGTNNKFYFSQKLKIHPGTETTFIIYFPTSVLKFGTRLKSAVLKPTFLLLGLSQLENVD